MAWKSEPRRPNEAAVRSYSWICAGDSCRDDDSCDKRPAWSLATVSSRVRVRRVRSNSDRTASVQLGKLHGRDQDPASCAAGFDQRRGAILDRAQLLRVARL